VGAGILYLHVSGVKLKIGLGLTFPQIYVLTTSIFKCMEELRYSPYVLQFSDEKIFVIRSALSDGINTLALQWRYSFWENI